MVSNGQRRAQLREAGEETEEPTSAESSANNTGGDRQREHEPGQWDKWPPGALLHPGSESESWHVTKTNPRKKVGLGLGCSGRVDCPENRDSRACKLATMTRQLKGEEMTESTQSGLVNTHLWATLEE